MVKRHIQTLKEALELIVDLATDNLLDAVDAETPELLQQYEIQQEAMSIVSDFISSMEES